MGKRRKYRFPHGINGVDRFFFPNRHTHPITDPNAMNGSGYFDYSADLGFGSDMYSPTDTLGSYTGFPTDGSEQPIQDADDL